MVCRMTSKGVEQFWDDATASWGGEDDATRFMAKQDAMERMWMLRKHTKGKRIHPVDYYISCVGDWSGDDDPPKAA